MRGGVRARARRASRSRSAASSASSATSTSRASSSTAACPRWRAPSGKRVRGRRLRARRASRARASSRASATRSPSSSRCTRRAACSSTASPSSACRRRSSPPRSRRSSAMGVEIVTDAVVGATYTVDELMAERGLRRRLHRRGRRAAGLPRHPGREPQRRVLGERVPHAREPHARLRLPHGTTRRSGAAARSPSSAAATSRWTRRAPRCASAPRRSSSSTGAREDEMPARRRRSTTRARRASSSRCCARPLEIVGHDGWVTGLVATRMELGEPDASGRRAPVCVLDSRVRDRLRHGHRRRSGTRANPLLDEGRARTSSSPRAATSSPTRTARRPCRACSPAATSSPGAATVILAMGAGKKAARGDGSLAARGPRDRPQRSRVALPCRPLGYNPARTDERRVVPSVW